MTPATLPPSRMLNFLMKVRQHTQSDLLSMYIGEPNVNRSQGMMIGYHLCQFEQGVKDDEYGQFRDWLRDKGEFPLEGWEIKYLRDCGGDHERAIRKYLDFVAEFLSTHRPSETP